MAPRDNVHRRRAKEHKLKQHRRVMLERVRLHVLPPLMQKGFSVTKRASDSNIFPLGHLRRNRPDGTADLLEIQFMTYQRAAFRINACAVPKEGVMTLGGLRFADELEAGGLHDHFEMYASPRFRRWFSLRFWRLRRPSEADYDKLARSVAEMLPELELALARGELGPHVRRVTYSFATPKENK